MPVSGYQASKASSVRPLATGLPGYQGRTNDNAACQGAI